MADINEYENLIPFAPPTELVPWLRERGCFNKNYIIYRATNETVIEYDSTHKEKVVQCTCTACERTFNMQYAKNEACRNSYSSAPFGFFNEATGERVISGQTTICPYCGEGVNVRHIGSFRSTFEDCETWSMTVHVIDGLPCLILWSVYRAIDKEARVKVVSHPYEAFVFDGKKTARYCAYYKYFTSFAWLDKWEKKAKCNDELGRIERILPFNKNILDGTALENSKFFEYVKASSNAHPVTYLRLYQKHKNTENLVTSGATRLLNDIIDREFSAPQGYWGKAFVGKLNLEHINWKEKRPAQMLGLNRSEFARAQKNKWDITTLDFYLNCKKTGELLTDEELSLCYNLGFYDSERLLEADIPRKTSKSFIKALRYLDRQKRKYPKDNVHSSLLTDYWNMSRRLGDCLDTEDEIYPQRLKTAHDTVVERINELKSKLRKKEFEKRYKTLEKYSWESEGLFVIPAKSEVELRREGKTLHHCVASYAERHATGKTAIFFIRQKESPEKPFYTLELDEKNLTVRQNRGLRNCDRTPEVITFEAEFLKHLLLLRSKKII